MRCAYRSACAQGSTASAAPGEVQRAPACSGSVKLGFSCYLQTLKPRTQTSAERHSTCERGSPGGGQPARLVRCGPVCCCLAPQTRPASQCSAQEPARRGQRAPGSAGPSWLQKSQGGVSRLCLPRTEQRTASRTSLRSMCLCSLGSTAAALRSPSCRRPSSWHCPLARSRGGGEAVCEELDGESREAACAPSRLSEESTLPPGTSRTLPWLQCTTPRQPWHVQECLLPALGSHRR